MIRCGIVVPENRSSIDLVDASPPISATAQDVDIIDRFIPSYTEMNLLLWDQPDNPARRLWDIALRTEVNLNEFLEAQGG